VTNPYPPPGYGGHRPGYPQYQQYPQPYGRPVPPNSGRGGRRFVTLIAVGVAMVMAMACTAGGVFLLFKETPSSWPSIDDGSQVTPTDELHTVYLTGRQPGKVTCTGTTADGEKFTLAPPTTNRRVSSARGGTKYWPIADAPTNKGPLAISCSSRSVDRLYLGRPSSWTRTLLYPALIAIPAFIAFMGVMLVMRQRILRHHLQTTSAR
jgi:hypothetical protein